MKEPTFEAISSEKLMDVWQRIGDDLLVAHEQNTGRDYMTGADLRWIIPDFVNPNDDPEWFRQWDALPREMREKLLYDTFPKTMRFCR